MPLRSLKKIKMMIGTKVRMPLIKEITGNSFLKNKVNLVYAEIETLAMTKTMDKQLMRMEISKWNSKLRK